MRKLLFVLIVQFLYIGSRAQKIMLPVEIEMKDNVPENILYSTDFDKRGRGVNAQEYFDSYNSYIGVTFCCPQKMEVCEPVSDYASPEGFYSIAMMCMKSDDGEFELRLSMPNIKRTYNKQDIWYGESDRKLYYDPDNPSTYTTLPGTLAGNANMQHHLYIAAHKATDVTTCTQRYARDMFNADTVKIYDVPANCLERMMEHDDSVKKYTRCKVIIIQKHDRGYFYAYALFTDKAYSKAEKYINSLKGMISYNDSFTPSWDTDTSTDKIILKQYEKAIANAKYGYGANITIPNGYKLYTGEGNDNGRTLLELNPCEYFGQTVAMTNEDGNELVVCNVAGKLELEMEFNDNLNILNVCFKEIPESYMPNIDTWYPSNIDFNIPEDERFTVCSGMTQKQNRIAFLDSCDDGSLRITPLHETYPYMQVWQKYYDGYRLRIYRFTTQKPSNDILPKVLDDCIK